MGTVSGLTRATVGVTATLVAVSYLHLHAGPPQSRPDPVQPQASHTQAVASPQRAVFYKYCVTCHNERLKTAGLLLDKLDVGQLGVQPDVWEKVVAKLRAGTMPPAGAPRPDKATYTSLVGWLEDGLDRAVAANPPAGRAFVRRLNRSEYTNAIRDLLALDIDGPSMLPTDESGYGFDNIADVLSVTPGLLDRYLLAAQKISRLAIGDPTIRPSQEIFPLSQFLVQTDRVSDDLPLNSRGGSAVRYYFPLDGEYVLKVRLRRAWQQGVINGVDSREELDVRLDDARVKLFTVGGECTGRADKCAEYKRTADAPLEVRFHANAGPRKVGVSFVRRNTATEGAGPDRMPQGRSVTSAGNGMSVEFFSVEGPFDPTGPGDTPSRRQILVCQPTGASSEEPCAKRILTTLARRAYRRRATDGDVQSLLRLYQAGRKSGSFEAGIQSALEGLLVSPHFLFRVEDAPGTRVVRTASRISDVELASRLSFFLWSSIPDDELLNLAVAGRLHDPKVLEQQTRRMLADARAASLVTDFAGQWLRLRNLRSLRPDAEVFPDFDDSLRADFERETELFLESQLRENYSVVDLLTANYTFVNERLARFYGIPGVYGDHFRRVTLTDPNRVGLLGQGSILTVTSYSTRTSPTVRGKWILETVLGSPPPPPPPVVPALNVTTAEGEQPATIRSRMEAHRKNPVCAGCHRPMDPLGFALENFDGVGKWRTNDAGVPIDSTGVLPDGTKFDTSAEFRQALLDRRDQYVRNVATKLLTYALGRGVEHCDMPSVRAIVREAGASDYRWSSMILGIVGSPTFQGPVPSAPEQAKRTD
jgi:mono/diheme cytochrome c family protein